ncbi:prolyl oligopeptidase family serine peptidase [Streptomyces sp. OF3]|uniref:Prolyl oligopeptidase family serine peptidase n=1 Tax=Streptomyces alkaliterrae TaxID=2213162 RepID=A0A7W3WGS7_9ACTN|nr:prolyl oligopeptidase family serine peptidase [Streptomyces alkaliterrae]MBB1252049.1 prolyl oligopeptidase family serine peptidase [Streptomyces alkaliterrae]
MRLRTKAAVAATTMLGTGAAALAVGRVGSGAALRPRRTDGPPGFEHAPLTVHDVGVDRITLTRTLDTLLPGTYGLLGADCHAVVGEVLSDGAGTADTVARRLVRITRGDLRAGTRVRMTPQIHSRDPGRALAIPYADGAIPGELGPLPAWFVHGDRDTWVITVHGLGTTREHPMNVLPLLYRLQAPVLNLAYRGDEGAPRSPDGVGHLGATEWRDVDAAVRYALRYGAERVVLHGWSTGATMALHTAVHSPLRRHVCGLVLDSPVLDWRATVRALAAGRVPSFALPLVERAVEGRAGLDHAHLTEVVDPRRLEIPVLLLHSKDDRVSPFGASRRFAERREELVSLYAGHHAAHAALWNADRPRYEEALRRFLTPLV